MRTSIFSEDCLSEVTKIHLYPRAIPAIANPRPVFPDVPSIIVPPGLSKPFLSASNTILIPILSLTEFPGLNVSYFAYTGQGKSFTILFNLTIGVLPIVSEMLLKKFIQTIISQI